MRNKAISFILVLLLVFTLTPVSAAYASEANTVTISSHSADSLQSEVDAYMSSHSIATYSAIENLIISSGTLTNTDRKFLYDSEMYKYLQSVDFSGADMDYYTENIDGHFKADKVNEVASYAFGNWTALQTVKLPNSVTSIKEWAFSNCTSLQTVYLPESLTSIEYAVFYYSSQLDSVYTAATVPPTAFHPNAFMNVASDAVLFVPEGAESSWDNMDSVMYGDDNGSLYQLRIENMAPVVSFYASRTSDTTATIDLSSNEPGVIYYSVVKDGLGAPTIDTSGAGEAFDGSNSLTIDLTGLEAGAYNFYYISKDALNNIGTMKSYIVAVPEADLEVDVSFGDQTGNTAGVVTYDATVRNDGPVSTTNVTVSVPLPSGVTLESTAIPAGTSYDQASGLWTVGTLDSNSEKVLEFKVIPDYSAEQTVTATVMTSDTADSNTENNSDSLTITARTDIAVSAAVDNPSPAVGDTITLTMAVINNGSIKATNVFVNAVLPAGLTYVSDNSDGSYDASKGWSVGSLKAGVTKTITIKATVSVSADQTVTAIVNANQPDPDLSNNAASVMISSKVTDTTPPAIVLLGDNPMTISYGGIYTEPGATVTDNCDSGLIAVITGTVNTAKAGSYTVTYTATDNSGNTATEARTVIVKENHAPVAVNDSYSTNRKTTLIIAAPGLLGNDTDIDGNSLTVVKAGKPAHGKLSFNADGSFSYTPDKYFIGTDSFKYYVSDGTSNSNSTTVVIKVVKPVNHTPIAVSDKYSTAKNTTLKIAAPGVLGNDTDADNNNLKALLLSMPRHGRLTFKADGSISYKPDKNFVGTDSFWYFVSDGSSWSNVATVTITVTKP